MDTVQTIVDAAFGGIVGSGLTILYAGLFRSREASGRRGQIVFLLRQLQIHMGMIRDFSEYYYYDVQPLVSQLTELCLTPLSASGLSSQQREAVFLAAYQVAQEASYLAKDREKDISNGDIEYVTASATRAFAKLQTARQLLNDAGTLLRPTDPRTLHTWRPGERIPGSTVP